MRYLIMIRLVLLLVVVVCLITLTTASGQYLTTSVKGIQLIINPPELRIVKGSSLEMRIEDPCEQLKRREKQLLDSLIKFEALKPAFENAKEIIDTYDKQLQEVRELQGMQAAIQDEQHRKELRQEKRKQRLKGIRDGFLGAITTAGIILILL